MMSVPPASAQAGRSQAATLRRSGRCDRRVYLAHEVSGVRDDDVPSGGCAKSQISVVIVGVERVFAPRPMYCGAPRT